MLLQIKKVAVNKKMLLQIKKDNVASKKVLLQIKKDVTANKKCCCK